MSPQRIDAYQSRGSESAACGMSKSNVPDAKNWGIPKTLPEAKLVLKRLEREVDDAKTWAEIEHVERKAEAIKVFWKHVDDVRCGAEWVLLLAGRRVAGELKQLPKATLPGPGRGKKTTSQASEIVSGRAASGVPKDTRSRLGRLLKISKSEMRDCAEELWKVGKEATRNAVLKFYADIKTKERRQKSRTAKPLLDGMELRIGDCRAVLADVPDNSVPLILTDPPYGDEAEPLYTWLAQFAARVLVPGGSLICYTGHSRLNRDIAILDSALRYWWLLVMLHDQSQRLPGKFVIVNFKPVLWYVKDFRRGRSLVPDILKSPARDKELHNWGQGEGGVSALIEHLTEPNELIVDPFAGSATWGRRAAHMGRRWLGADVKEGGTETVVAAAE